MPKTDTSTKAATAEPSALDTIERYDDDAAPTPTGGPEPSASTHVVVTHESLGPWPRGSVLSLAGLRAIGADLRRLVRIGAIGPFDPNVPPAGSGLRTLAEAVRSESSPTLPQAPDTTATPAELFAAANPRDTRVTGPLDARPGTEAPVEPLNSHTELLAAYTAGSAPEKAADKNEGSAPEQPPA